MDLFIPVSCLLSLFSVSGDSSSAHPTTDMSVQCTPYSYRLPGCFSLESFGQRLFLLSPSFFLLSLILFILVLILLEASVSHHSALTELHRRHLYYYIYIYIIYEFYISIVASIFLSFYLTSLYLDPNFLGILL